MHFERRKTLEMVRRTAALAVLCMATVPGCELFSRGGGEARSIEPASLIDPLVAKKLGYAPRWATDLGVPAGQTLSHVEVLGDVVVCVESPSNMVTAVSMRDGGMLWRQIVGKPADELFTPVRTGDSVLINSEQVLYVLAIDTGKLSEISELKTLVHHAPAVVEGLAVFGGMNHRAFAHDARAGYTKWEYQLTERVFARPTAFGENVFVADGNGVYAMFVARTGRLLWKGRTFAKVSAQPAISHMGVFLAGEDHSLYALHGATGRDRWIYHTTQPLTQSPKVFGNIVILPMGQRGLVALDARTGEETWRLPFVADPVMQFEETLLLLGDGRLLTMDIGTGNVLMEVPVASVKKVLLGPEKQLILLSPGGRLLLLDPLP